MENEKVVQIIAFDGQIFGLSESGKVVQYDKNHAGFVLKGEGHILDIKTNNHLKRHSNKIEAPNDRYNRHDSPKEVTKNKTVYIVIGSSLAVACLLVGIYILFKVIS